jgi:hypothetical protein
MRSQPRSAARASILAAWSAGWGWAISGTMAVIWRTRYGRSALARNVHDVDSIPSSSDLDVARSAWSVPSSSERYAAPHRLRSPLVIQVSIPSGSVPDGFPAGRSGNSPRPATPVGSMPTVTAT